MMVSSAISAAVRSFSGNEKKNMYLYVGTYDSDAHRGIYVFRFDAVTGDFERAGGVDLSNPSYLACASSGNYLYAISESGEETMAAAAAFSLDGSAGNMRFLNRRNTGGADPCYVAVDSGNRLVVTANYSGGSISVFPVSGQDATLLPVVQVIKFEGSGPDEVRQKKAHLHCVVFSPDEKYLFACDLGSDKIYRFRVRYDNTSAPLQYIDAFSLEPGTGPRHLTFHPSGRYAYLIGELSGKVSVLEYGRGVLSLVQTVVADQAQGRGSADIHVSPDGRYLYISNRLKADGIAIFAIDIRTGKLTRAGYRSTGCHPRSFVITPCGNYLLVACRDENAIQVFKRDKVTGLLSGTGKKIQAERPVCLKLSGY